MTTRSTRLLQAVLVIGCLSSLGCSSYRQPPYPAMWEIEQVALGKAQAAYRSADGSIAVRYHIQRKHQPGHTGYHWLVIEPKAAEQVLTPKADFHYPPHSHYERTFVRVRSEASDPKFNQPVNARMIPGILEPGLPNNQPPEGVAQPLVALVMVFNDEGYLSLRDPDRPGIETRQFDLWPTGKRYQTEQGAAWEARYRKVTRPFIAVGDILVAPCHFLIDAYIDWVWSKQRIK